MEIPNVIIINIKNWLQMNKKSRNTYCPFKNFQVCTYVFPEILRRGNKMSDVDCHVEACPCHLLGEKEVEERFNTILKENKQ